MVRGPDTHWNAFVGAKIILFLLWGENVYDVHVRYLWPGSLNNSLLSLLSQGSFAARIPKSTIVRGRNSFSKKKCKITQVLKIEIQLWGGDKAKVSVDKETFLAPDSAGGVEALSKGGRIKVSSTLESRLDLIATQVSFAIHTWAAKNGSGGSRVTTDNYWKLFPTYIGHPKMSRRLPTPMWMGFQKFAFLGNPPPGPYIVLNLCQKIKKIATFCDL